MGKGWLSNNAGIDKKTKFLCELCQLHKPFKTHGNQVNRWAIFKGNMKIIRKMFSTTSEIMFDLIY